MARLVAKGYDQVPGVDFKFNFAPVTTEVTLRILLVLWIINDHFAEVADVKTTFLHGDLDEEIYINLPEGYKEFLEKEFGETTNGSYLSLEKALYGLVQAARQWFLKLTNKLKNEMGFDQFSNDSCLFK